MAGIGSEDAAPFVTAYLRAVRAGDRRAAVDVTLDMLDHGAPAEDVIARLLAPAQAEVGRGWQDGRWGVAVEHRATSITESALFAVMTAATTSPGLPPEGSRGRAAVVCAEGEWHSLPARMMADVLRLRGVDVSFVGPGMPASELDDFFGAQPPVAVAVSCSLSQSLPGAWRAITVLRRLGCTVCVGGQGFGPHGIWASAVGADHWAPTFPFGADLILHELQSPPSSARPSPVPEDRVADLRDIERVADATLVRALAEATAAWPAMMARDLTVRSLRDDLRASLRIVAAAVLVDDPQLVTWYARWFEALLAARQQPPGLVPSVFELLLHQLPPGLVVARGMVEAGLASCSAAPLSR